MQICGDRSDCSGLVGRLGGGLSLCQEVPGSLQTCVDAPTCPVSLQAAVAKDGLASHSGSCAEAEDSCSKTCGVCDSKGVHIWAKPAGRLVADAAPRCVLIGQKQVGWFACANGLSCVAESAVLNQWFDCHDRSDEKSKPLSVLCDSLTLSHRAWVSRTAHALPPETLPLTDTLCFYLLADQMDPSLHWVIAIGGIGGLGVVWSIISLITSTAQTYFTKRE